MKEAKVIGVIGAMESEVETLRGRLCGLAAETAAGITFFIGTISGQKVVLAKCGVGKVNAARATQLLIDRYKPDFLFNTGIAGGIAPRLNVADAVIAAGFIHHDFDATAFGYVKGCLCAQEARNKPTVFTASPFLTGVLKKSALAMLPPGRVKEGLVVTGDAFVSDPQKKQALYGEFRALAVEMEGAAFAQTAYYNNVPFAAVRAISDLADGKAAAAFDVFEKETADLSAALIEKAVYYIKESGETPYEEL